MLTAEGIAKQFFGVAALDGVDVQIGGAEIVGLVGPNGSGKSTLLNVLSGFAKPDAGSVSIDGTRIEGRRPWSVAKLGIQRTFQLPAQPERMTVLEVMLVGAELPVGSRVGASLLHPRRVAAEQSDGIERARALLAELNLLELEHHAAGMLSGGQQKLLSLGAAMMGSPRVLLLDEPTAGVHPNLRRTLAERLRKVHQSGTSVVIVEHDMAFVAQLCERVYVLDKGNVVTCCAPSELADDERVIEAYLGSRRPARSVAGAATPPQTPGLSPRTVTP